MCHPRSAAKVQRQTWLPYNTMYTCSADADNRKSCRLVDKQPGLLECGCSCSCGCLTMFFCSTDVEKLKLRRLAEKQPGLLEDLQLQRWLPQDVVSIS
jgi:hypothetical protein